MDRQSADASRRNSRLIAQDSKSRALAMVERIIDRSAQLELAPSSGARLPVIADDEVRELLEQPYRIVYRVTDTAVQILTVKHYRQRLVDRPQDLW